MLYEALFAVHTRPRWLLIEILSTTSYIYSEIPKKQLGI
jgi:hypothetical protein